MKKLSIALAVAGAYAATGAGAAVLGDYDQGCLVPSAIHSATTNTVVGITSRVATTVHWTFFDVNSNHVSDGEFSMTANDQHAFSMSASAGALTSGVQGYLVFSAETVTAGHALTSATEAIACNAFYITSNDAAYIPAVSLGATDYSGAAAGNLSTLDSTSIIGLGFGSGYTFARHPLGSNAALATNIHMRYWIDGATGGRDTSVVIWSSASISANYTVNMYNDAQLAQSVTMALTNAELNIYNPENQIGRPAGHLDGFVDWNITAAIASGVLVYSVVTDPTFGATQTLMGASF